MFFLILMYLFLRYITNKIILIILNSLPSFNLPSISSEKKWTCLILMARSRLATGKHCTWYIMSKSKSFSDLMTWDWDFFAKIVPFVFFLCLEYEPNFVWNVNYICIIELIITKIYITIKIFGKIHKFTVNFKIYFYNINNNYWYSYLFWCNLKYVNKIISIYKENII